MDSGGIVAYQSKNSSLICVWNKSGAELMGMEKFVIKKARATKCKDI